MMARNEKEMFGMSEKVKSEIAEVVEWAKRNTYVEMKRFGYRHVRMSKERLAKKGYESTVI